MPVVTAAAPRILLTTWGSLGDLHPYLGLAQRLAAEGCHPVIATCGIYRPLVDALGIEFHAVRPDIDPNDTTTIVRVMDARKGSGVVVEELVAPAVVGSYEDLLPLARQADVLVSHPITFATPLAASVLRKPWLSTVLAPASFFSIHDFTVPPPMPALGALAKSGPLMGRLFRWLARSVTATWTGPVRALRADLGLPDTGDPLYEGQFSPFGTLALFSRVLASVQPDWPPHTEITGFVFRPTGAALPPALAAFLDAGDAPIVFTLGSSAVGAAGRFYDDAAGAAEQLGRRAVLLVGRNPARQTAWPLPPSMIAVDYAPHDLLFPRAAAIVHHGGVGTLGEALRAGKPMLIVPFAHDQPDNAWRAVRAGVARSVNRSRISSNDLACHLDALLHDEPCARRAAAIGQIVGGEDGAGAAAKRIAALLLAPRSGQSV